MSGWRGCMWWIFSSHLNFVLSSVTFLSSSLSIAMLHTTASFVHSWHCTATKPILVTYFVFSHKWEIFKGCLHSGYWTSENKPRRQTASWMSGSLALLPLLVRREAKAEVRPLCKPLVGHWNCWSIQKTQTTLSLPHPFFFFSFPHSFWRPAL